MQKEKGVFCGAPEKYSLANRMRANPTPPEAGAIAGLRQIGRGDYRFQVVMLGWIVDFLFPDLRLIIEIDGNHHRENRAYDAKRDAVLASHGYKTIRIQAVAMFNRDTRERVLRQILGMSNQQSKHKRHKRRRNKHPWALDQGERIKQHRNYLALLSRGRL